MTEQSGSANVGTVRTTVNTTILVAIAAILAKVFKVKVEAEDLLPYAPIAVPVVAIFYRLSRAVTDRWPQIGYVLFGNTRPPDYPASLPAPAPPDPPGGG